MSLPADNFQDPKLRKFLTATYARFSALQAQEAVENEKKKKFAETVNEMEKQTTDFFATLAKTASDRILNGQNRFVKFPILLSRDDFTFVKCDDVKIDNEAKEDNEEEEEEEETTDDDDEDHRHEMDTDDDKKHKSKTTGLESEAIISSTSSTSLMMSENKIGDPKIEKIEEIKTDDEKDSDDEKKSDNNDNNDDEDVNQEEDKYLRVSGIKPFSQAQAAEALLAMYGFDDSCTVWTVNGNFVTAEIEL